MRGTPTGTFFVLTFVISWSYWIPDALTGGHWSHFPGLLGPAIAALRPVRRGMAAGHSRCVLVVALWHTMLNMASATDGTTSVAPVVSIVVIAIAIVMLRVARAALTPERQ